MTYPTEQPSHKAMTRENPSNQPERLTDSECEPVIAAYLAGNQEAAERLSRLLDHHARITAEAFLKQNQSEVDDVIQDTVIAVMAYLKRRGEFSGSVVNFTISVARNRCRNYLIWKKRYAAADLEPLQSYLASQELGPLDTLAEKERHEFLQEALQRADQGTYGTCSRCGQPIDPREQVHGPRSSEALHAFHLFTSFFLIIDSRFLFIIIINWDIIFYHSAPLSLKSFLVFVII